MLPKESAPEPELCSWKPRAPEVEPETCLWKETAPDPEQFHFYDRSAALVLYVVDLLAWYPTRRVLTLFQHASYIYIGQVKMIHVLQKCKIHFHWKIYWEFCECWCTLRTHMCQYCTTQLIMYILGQLYSDTLHWMEAVRVLMSCYLSPEPLRSTGWSWSTHWAPLSYMLLLSWTELLITVHCS